MNDLSIGNTDLDCGIRQLSNEEIDLVSGGVVGGMIRAYQIGNILMDLWNNHARDPIVDAIEEMSSFYFDSGSYPPSY